MVTLSSNYKQVLQPETVEEIEKLLDEGDDLRDILEYIDTYSEKDFARNYEYYASAVDNLPVGAVDAFIEEFGLDCINEAEHLFYGEYSSLAAFVVDYYDQNYNIPSELIVDWEATYEQYLYSDFTYSNGFVFRNN